MLALYKAQQSASVLGRAHCSCKTCIRDAYVRTHVNAGPAGLCLLFVMIRLRITLPTILPGSKHQGDDHAHGPARRAATTSYACAGLLVDSDMRRTSQRPPWAGPSVVDREGDPLDVRVGGSGLARGRGTHTFSRKTGPGAPQGQAWEAGGPAAAHATCIWHHRMRGAFHVWRWVKSVR